MKKFWTIVLLNLIACHAAPPSSSISKGSIQSIPGRIQCEFYETGGEGIAYHDTDSVNNGSGKLNPPNGTYLNEFRMGEGVDISYTKAKNIDTNPFNVTNPELDQLYVGWTKPGEWFQCKVNVKQSGLYHIGVMYTSNGDGKINVQFDESKTSVPISIPSTYNAQDTIAWRQWHHWRRLNDTAEVSLKKGVNTMKVEIVENGNINLDYIELIKK